MKATYPIRNERDRNLQLLDEAYKNLAFELSVEFISMYGVVPEVSMNVDGVHPDVKGNMPIKDKFVKYLSEHPT